MKTNLVYLRLLALLYAGWLNASAQVPHLVNYQGRIQVGTNNFDGTGLFKFALVGGTALNNTTFWSNDGTSVNGSEPRAAVSLPVSKGLYSVLLGDVTRSNMTVLPATAFASDETYLRVWFNDGVSGFQQLRPDQRIGAVAYAITAASVADGSITAQKLASGAITGDKLAPSSVGTAQLGEGSVTASKISAQAVGQPQLADGSVNISKIDPQFSLWNKLDSNLSYSGGNVGIGTGGNAPQARLDVSGPDNVALFNSSATVGTWLRLRNSSPVGEEWSLISSGRDTPGGPGHLLFFRTADRSSKMKLDVNGNLTVSGDISARNIPGLQSSVVQFSQANARVEFYEGQNTKNIDEIRMVIPAPGFIQITAFVDAEMYGLARKRPKFTFILYDATSEQVEFTRVHSYIEGLEDDESDDPIQLATRARIPLHLSWVAEAASPRTFVLRTQGEFQGGLGTGVKTYAHNLTAIYLAGRAQQ